MADLRVVFVGIPSPNPFWLTSAPPTDRATMPAVLIRPDGAGWSGRRSGLPRIASASTATIWGADRRLLALNNIELIIDRPLEVNLREIMAVKHDWPDRAMVASLMVPCDEESWRSILPLVWETGFDGVELNFGCSHGISERGMGSAVGQVPPLLRRPRGNLASGDRDESRAGLRGEGRQMRCLQPLREHLSGGGLHQHAADDPPARPARAPAGWYRPTMQTGRAREQPDCEGGAMKRNGQPRKAGRRVGPGCSRDQTMM